MSANFENISLYIPHIFANYGKDKVAKVFEDLQIGKVKHVDFVLKMGKDGKAFNAAYIHFDRWYANSAAINFQERVKDPVKQARLVYDEPWFWIVLENKGQKHDFRAPRIDLTNDSVAINLTPLFEAAIDDSASLEAAFQERSQFEEYAFKREMEDEIDQQRIDEFFNTEIEVFRRMDETELAWDSDESQLINIDGRYVQTMEQENVTLRQEIEQLRADVCHRDSYIAINLRQWTAAYSAV